MTEGISTPAEGHDYLAVIPIGGGSSWGRSTDKEVAIKNAITALRDWEHLFKVSEFEVLINVIDIHGYSDCWWGGGMGGTLRGKNEATGQDEPIDRPVEHVKRVTPKWRRRK